MAGIAFSPDERTALIEKLQTYCTDELDRKLGNLEAECLLDFIASEFGPHIYNRALYDAQVIVHSRAELIGEAVIELEKAVNIR